MALAGEREVDASMGETLSAQPVAHSGGMQELDRPVLEYPGPHTLLHVLLAAALEDDRVDPLAQQDREHQPCGACSDDADVGAPL